MLAQALQNQWTNEQVIIIILPGICSLEDYTQIIFLRMLDKIQFPSTFILLSFTSDHLLNKWLWQNRFNAPFSGKQTCPKTFWSIAEEETTAALHDFPLRLSSSSLILQEEDLVSSCHPLDRCRVKSHFYKISSISGGFLDYTWDIFCVLNILGVMYVNSIDFLEI